MASATAVTAALLKYVIAGNTTRAKAALEAGADVNGCPELPYAPILAAIAWDNANMVNFLVEQGADPNKPTDHEVLLPNSGGSIMAGARPLQLAARRGNVEIVSLLLEGAHADPNATDHSGGTSLMAACVSLKNGVAVLRLLLEAGVDPAVTEPCGGFTAMHLVARYGVSTDLVDMLYTGAPATLSQYSTIGYTPLYVACSRGHEGMVSRLLSLGAMQQSPLDERKMCPLTEATRNGFAGVVRILLNKGLGVFGGMEALAMALYSAIRHHQAKILHLLLAVDGGETTPIDWANTIIINETSLLHHGAGFCCPASVNILLAVGANELLRDVHGRLPRDAIGRGLDQGVWVDRGKVVAIRRILEQGPAYRARSWAWPTEEADGGGCGVGGAAFSSAPPAAPKLPVGLQIFRPKVDRKFFASLVGRYCEKN